eukprot:CAMPEP_0115492046 /NCGR_PEP_ID=MMETSP0271-20121206/63434_1 /TAXON_ID=71861 /ORGANISM="Scrippsiella trochoidea, Strain CCMP3099" /LENGTH=58 /DNA_ID=CAMNT_0002920445 /DNA_START=51 /DNA_END=224 /DNA_ORIENTATION=-
MRNDTVAVGLLDRMRHRMPVLEDHAARLLKASFNNTVIFASMPNASKVESMLSSIANS